MPIEPEQPDGPFQHAVDSAMFIRFTRIAVVLGTLVGLPIAGFGLSRLITKGEQLADMAEHTSVQMQLLEQSVKLTLESRGREFEGIATLVRDHETRLRAVERGQGVYTK